MAMTQPPWYDHATEALVRGMFAERGVASVYLKFLGRNNNSKQQIYLGPDLSEISSIPMGEITESAGTSRKPGGGGQIYKASVEWAWIGPNADSVAPNAQLIYYPQYPEVRLSGLLYGTSDAPRELLNIDARGQELGRLLIFGKGAGNRVYAAVLPSTAPAVGAFANYFDGENHLATVPIDSSVPTDTRANLMRELFRIHQLGWLDPIELPTNGVLRPCRGPRCGGHTLEAHLGIQMNGSPTPDFADWEVKSHRVANFARPAVGKVTLFTPEPDRGAYSEFGVDWFVRRMGVAKSDGSRYDFTGTHSVSGLAHAKTGLTLSIVGYDQSSGALAADGMIALKDIHGGLVSGWSFAKLLEHWQRKHAKAAYVPVRSQKLPTAAFEYGNLVHFAEGTRFGMFLRAMSAGFVVYDPGIKSEQLPDGRWKAKARSQFRIDFRSLGELYDEFELVDVSSGAV